MTAVDSPVRRRLRVSVVVPARDEERHIETCLSSIFRQEVEGDLEVVVAVGSSADRTAELARAAGAIVVANSLGTTPAGLNAALRHARGEIVVRFDAHAEMPQGYVAACVRALEGQRGALVCVGGWREVRGRGPWGRATASALASRFGVGNPRIWRPPHPEDGPVEVDTVALGAWFADELRAVGGWDERYVRNQDFELNERLRHSGGRVVFAPDVWSVYRPRESQVAIASQYWDYGRFKALLLRERPESLRPRQLAPVGLLATLLAAALPGPARRPARLAVSFYALTVGSVAARSRAGWRTAAVLVTMHLAWGAGLVAGFARRRQ
jgi:succinoglycan biosynthesis protein ExoA